MTNIIPSQLNHSKIKYCVTWVLLFYTYIEKQSVFTSTLIRSRCAHVLKGKINFFMNYATNTSLRITNVVEMELYAQKGSAKHRQEQLQQK